jgi:hypothetical protein
MSRSLTETEIATIATLALELPGRWTAETERTDDGQLYIGLVERGIDKRAFLAMVSGTEGGNLTVHDWEGDVLAEGVAMDAALAAIREALKPD